MNEQTRICDQRMHFPSPSQGLINLGNKKIDRLSKAFEQEENTIFSKVNQMEALFPQKVFKSSNPSQFHFKSWTSDSYFNWVCTEWITPVLHWVESCIVCGSPATQKHSQAQSWQQWRVLLVQFTGTPTVISHSNPRGLHIQLPMNNSPSLYHLKHKWNSWI